MNRTIAWKSMELDEIELVYEKAEEDSGIASLMEQLEAQALTEAKNNVGMLKTDGGISLSSEQFDNLSANDKETVIKILGNAGISALNTEIQTAAIIVRLSSIITKVQACTIFNLLNRIEKLDGAINILKPKWTLELQVPLGGKKGLFQWEMLIMQLYPWISVRETATNEIVEGAGSSSQSDKSKAESQKRSDKNSASFYNEMIKRKSFAESYELAKAELGLSIKRGQFSPSIQGKNISYNQWVSLDEMDKMNLVLAMGNHGISVRSCICVDFAEVIPNCIAIMLLYSVWSGQGKTQLIDAGDNTNVAKFSEALTRLYCCVSEWDCTIAHPVFVKIGEQKAASSETAQSSPQGKKSFWQKLFGK